MKILLFILTILPLSAFASLEGSYELIKGPELCPNGNLSIKSDKSERVLIFGGSHSWTLNLSDKGETSEKADGGCSYKTQYEKTENLFTSKTIRELCPDKKENSETKESLELKNNKLVYKNEAAGKNSGYECLYKKI